jgi:hypothetical protein
MTRIMVARSCGTGTSRRLDSRVVPATRNRPVTGSRPFLATCSAYRAPCEIPARKTGHDRAAPSPSRWVASSARNRASSRSGSPAGGRAGCQAPFQPSGKTVVIPAAGPRLASSVNQAMPRPSMPDPCSAISKGGAAWPSRRGARASQYDRRTPATSISPRSSSLPPRALMWTKRRFSQPPARELRHFVRFSAVAGRWHTRATSRVCREIYSVLELPIVL